MLTRLLPRRSVFALLAALGLPGAALAGGKPNGAGCVHDHQCGSGVCCAGACHRACGPRRQLHPRTCRCCKRTRSGDWVCG